MYAPQDANVCSGECAKRRRRPKLLQKLHIRKFWNDFLSNQIEFDVFGHYSRHLCSHKVMGVKAKNKVFYTDKKSFQNNLCMPRRTRTYVRGNFIAAGIAVGESNERRRPKLLQKNHIRKYFSPFPSLFDQNVCIIQKKALPLHPNLPIMLWPFA